ncbi:MAG: SRPBCC domain-containing protein [Planctomycetaceae bacterium]
MIEKSKAATEDTSDREIVISRLFDAPRELVWRVWTDPEHVPQWWGPSGFTTTTHEMEVKPGGVWRFVMHGPDGQDYENINTYLEVVEPELLSYKHGGEKEAKAVNFTARVTFEKAGDDGRQTIVTLKSIFPSAKARDYVIQTYNAIEGGKQTLARLGEYLNTVSARGASATEPPFVISRVFHAPREVVYRAWTEREQLQQWFGPKGTTIPTCSLDLRPGGMFLYAMQSPSGSIMWGRWIFREIDPPHKLVFVVSFSDASGGITRAPFEGQWPLEMLTVVTFEEHAGIGRGTLVTVQSSAIGGTQIECDTFFAGHESMKGGWTGTLDQLSEHLSSLGDQAGA